VVLTGEGSDELLAGYNRYRVTDYNMRLGRFYQSAVPGPLRAGVSSLIGALPSHSRLRAKLDRTFLTRDLSLDELYFENFAVFGKSRQSSLLTARVRDQIQGIDAYEAYHAALDNVSGRPLVSQLLYTDAKTYLHELLMKQDQMSMAASIESRVPFLDHPFAEWIASLPVNVKLRGTTTKWVLRQAMKGRLPPEILGRRKMGFPVPVGAWFRGKWGHLMTDYVLSDRAAARGIFEVSAVRQLVEEHRQGVNHSERLWSLLNFEVWARQFLDGEDYKTMLCPA
jgi:asparagine synthase (glutamine-hydrolysing)